MEVVSFTLEVVTVTQVVWVKAGAEETGTEPLTHLVANTRDVDLGEQIFVR